MEYSTSKKLPKAAVIIPAYNPTGQLIHMVEDLQAAGFHSIIVVNDGSSNNISQDIFQRIKFLGCDLLTHPNNQGKGRALKTAFEYFLNTYAAEYNGVITVDADGQHTVKDILRMEEALFSFTDGFILGYRNFTGKSIPLRSKLGNTISRAIVSFLCGTKIHDTQTGLRAIHQKHLKFFLELPGERYEYEMNMLLAAQKNDLPLYQIPIETVYFDHNRGSHFNTLKDSAKIYEIIFKYALSSLASIVIDFTVFALLNLLGSNYILNTYLSRLCSSAVNFSMNKNLVFRHKQAPIGAAIAKYYLLLLFSGGISGIFISLMNHFFSLNPLCCKIIIECFLFFFNYYMQKKYIFKVKKSYHYKKQ